MSFRYILISVICMLSLQACDTSNPEVRDARSIYKTQHIIKQLVANKYRGEKGLAIMSAAFVDANSISDKPSYISLCIDLKGREYGLKGEECADWVTLSAAPLLTKIPITGNDKKDQEIFTKYLKNDIEPTVRIGQIFGKEFGVYHIVYSYVHDGQHREDLIMSNYRGQLDSVGQHAFIGSYIFIVVYNPNTKRPTVKIVANDDDSEILLQNMKKSLQEQHNIPDSGQIMKIENVAAMQPKN